MDLRQSGLSLVVSLSNQRPWRYIATAYSGQFADTGRVDLENITQAGFISARRRRSSAASSFRPIWV